MKLLLDQGLPRSAAILLLSVLVIICIQTATLAYGDLGKQALATNRAKSVRPY
jgi:hypothetical protein